MRTGLHQARNWLTIALAALFSAACLPTVAHSQGAAAPIKGGDLLHVEVFNEASLTGDFEVTSAGTINFPLLGRLMVAGSTPDQVGEGIEAMLEKDYIRDAQVSLDLAGRKALSLQVIGAVASPGPVQFEPGSKMDLFTAITLAGGPTPAADTYRVELKRHDGGNLTEKILGLQNDKSFALKEGDMIIVPLKPEVIVKVEEVKTYTVSGHVKNPGVYPLPKSGQMNIVSAIAEAGGESNLARLSKVKVLRKEGAANRAFPANVEKMKKGEEPPFIILPNDIITVPESIF